MGGLRLPWLMDEGDRSRPHPGLNCQEPGGIFPGCRSQPIAEGPAEARSRCQMYGDKCNDT